VGAACRKRVIPKQHLAGPIPDTHAERPVGFHAETQAEHLKEQVDAYFDGAIFALWWDYTRDYWFYHFNWNGLKHAAEVAPNNLEIKALATPRLDW
jgi:hypothetical protein